MTSCQPTMVGWLIDCAHVNTCKCRLELCFRSSAQVSRGEGSAAYSYGNSTHKRSNTNCPETLSETIDWHLEVERLWPLPLATGFYKPLRKYTRDSGDMVTPFITAQVPFSIYLHVSNGICNKDNVYLHFPLCLNSLYACICIICNWLNLIGNFEGNIHVLQNVIMRLSPLCTVPFSIRNLLNYI